MLAESISTLMFSWGSEAPAEVYWALTEMIQFINAETGVQLEDLPGEEFTGEARKIYDKLINFLESPACNEQDSEPVKFETKSSILLKYCEDNDIPFKSVTVGKPASPSDLKGFPTKKE